MVTEVTTHMLYCVFKCKSEMTRCKSCRYVYIAIKDKNVFIGLLHRLTRITNQNIGPLPTRWLIAYETDI